MLSFQVRKELYNRCNPALPLEAMDDRNVDIDAATSPEGRVRGIAWARELTQAISLSDTPPLLLLTGLPGSGKSTELRRLARALEAPEGPRLLPVLVDGEDVLDLTSAVDVPDILTAIVHTCEQTVRALEGDTSGPGYLERLWEWLLHTDAQIKTLQPSVPGIGSLVLELKTRPAFRQVVREAVASHLSGFLAEARRELVQLDARVRARGYSGLVVLFDSLEKLSGTSTTWEEVLESVERLFVGGAPYLRLPVPVLYTIPPALVARRFEAVRFLPMIKLRDRSGAPYEPGLRVARELVRRRVPDTVLAELLGPNARERLDRVLLWSGGYPREIVRLLRGIVAAEVHPVTDTEVDRLLTEVRDAYRMVVPASAFGWLAQVAHERYLTLADDSHRASADLMLSNSVVLPYQNQESWFDLHPAVKEIPGVQAAIQALEATACA